MNELRDAAYQIDPVLWVREILGVEPTAGSKHFCARRADHPFWR